MYEHSEALRNAASLSAATRDARLIRLSVTGTNWTAETRWLLEDTISSLFCFFWSTSLSLTKSVMLGVLEETSLHCRIGNQVNNWKLLLDRISFLMQKIKVFMFIFRSVQEFCFLIVNPPMYFYCLFSSPWFHLVSATFLLAEIEHSNTCAFARPLGFFFIYLFI